MKPPERSSKIRSWVLIIATNLISLLCLAWVLNGAGLRHIWGEVRHMHYGWVTGAILSAATIYVFHAWRWQLLLWPVNRVPFMQAVEAIYVGLFANEVLPLRAGEVIRCFLLSKSTGIPLSVTFASALIERIFDGVWLMAGFFFCLRIGRLPGVLVHGGYILGVIIILLTLLLLGAIYVRQHLPDRALGFSWPNWFSTLIADLQLIGHSRFIYYSFLVSGVYMMAQMIPIYMLVKAYRLQVPWTASFVMLILLRMSSIIPQAPGNLGPFQWVTARTLILFGMAVAHAKRFSLILWAGLTLPLILIGAVALGLEGINMSHLQKEATEAARERPKSG